MKKISVILVVMGAACGTAFAANPFEGLKGHMKPGMYQYKMETQMPGMPGGMGSHAMTLERCVTEQDVASGNFSKGERQPKDCEFTDVKQSGNTVSYKMVCTGQMQMTADAKITLRDNGFVSDVKMNMDKGPTGQPMVMSQHMEGTYKGPCSK